MGNCPYVVNMVGCCTLQEPLSLVLEYIPSRDLRTYLWTIRQMVSNINFIAHRLVRISSIEDFIYSIYVLNRLTRVIEQIFVIIFSLLLQRNATYANLPSMGCTVQENGSETVNFTEAIRSPPITPLTPASDCPLLDSKERGSSPSENPYSSLGELTPIDLISFAHQIARGMVS